MRYAIPALAVAALTALAFGLGLQQRASAATDEFPQTVHFKSKDGSTDLTGYLFMPRGAPARKSAIVLMHGRAGPYSSLAHGVYDATTLSKRHAFWGHYWAERGYVALLVDGF